MKIWTLALVSAAACASTLAAAAGPQQYYPAPALRACLSGTTTVHCTVGADGTLGDCSILSETPTDKGFGEATLAITRIWRIRPRTVTGVPTAGGTFQRTVVWLPPPDCGATWLNHMSLDAFYPADALRERVSGRAVVQCNVSNEGRMSGCNSLSEQPAGYGFGEATVRMYQTGLRLMVTPEIARGGAVITRTVSWIPPRIQSPVPAPTPTSP